MNNTVFRLPVLVTYRRESGYGIRPLFTPFAVVWHKRFARAQEIFSRNIQREFSSITNNHETFSQSLWLGFNPRHYLKIYNLEVKIGKKFLRGPIGLIHFSVNSVHYAVFPLLNHTMTILKSKPKAEAAVSEEIQDFLANYFRQFSIDDYSDKDLESFFCDAKDYCSEFEIAIRINNEKLGFEDSSEYFFSHLPQNTSFDGEEELRNAGYDLLDLYPEHLMNAYKRDEQVDRLYQLLFQQDPTCLCIIGPHGCGKTAIIHNALQKHVTEKGLEERQRLRKIWYLDPLRIISGMSIVGMWQRRFQAIISFVSRKKKKHNNDIVFIDNPVALFRIGKSAQNSLTLADVLKPHLERRAFSLLIETTLEQWEKIQESDRRFADLFQVIRIEVPNDSDAIAMMANRRAEVERNTGCIFTTDSLRLLWKLSNRVSTRIKKPGAISDTLQQLAAHSLSITNSKSTDTSPQDTAIATIETDHVLAHFAKTHQFCQRILDPQYPLSDADISRFLDQRLIGQTPAKTCLAEIIHTIKANLSNPQRPLASALFIGPTGVGKTEAAKVLNEFLFESSDNLVRFDMNEYIDDYAVARLVGDSFNPNGLLTSRVRMKNACVLLLDEIEKAHPSVHNLLLQVLGEARLTDALGQTTDFSQCVIIMTSNLGAQDANKMMGFITDASSQQHTYMEAVQRFFRPEFINRIDQIVAFKQLGPADIQKISTIMLQKLLLREGLQRRTTFLKIDHNALEKVAADAFDPQLGARALKRNLEKNIITIAAERLSIIPPDQMLLLDIGLDGNKLAANVQTIEYTQPQPLKLPSNNNASIEVLYEDLSQKILSTRDKLRDAIDSKPEQQIRLWSVGEGLHELQQVVDKICWDIESWRNKPVADKKFVLKTPNQTEDWRVIDPDNAIWSSHIQNRFEISHLLNGSVAIKDIVHGLYLQHFLDWWAQSQMIDATINSDDIEITLTLKSLVDQMGKEVTDQLAYYYSKFLATLGLSVNKEQLSETHIVLSFEAPGQFNFLDNECGLHIFEIDNFATVPVIVELSSTRKSKDDTMNVIRYYKTGEQQNGIIDLRTGLFCNRKILTEEWPMLLYNETVDSLSPYADI